METRPTRSSLRHVEPSRQGPVVAGELLSRLRRHEGRLSQLRVRPRGAQSARPEVLGRLRAGVEAAARRARRAHGAQAEGLAAGRRLRRAAAGAVRGPDARAAAGRVHVARRQAQPGRAPARVLRAPRPGAQDVHGVRRRRRHHQPAPGRERRRQRDGVRVGARRRARARARGGPRRGGGGRGRAVAAARAPAPRRRAVAHLRGARRRQDPRLPGARRAGARRAPAPAARPRARPDLVPGRRAARAPVPRVRRRGLRHPAVPRRRGVRPRGRAAPGAQPAGLHQGGRGFRLAGERVALLRAGAAVPPSVAAALQQGGQAADQEHRVPRGEGFALLLGGGAGRRQVSARPAAAAPH